MSRTSDRDGLNTSDGRGKVPFERRPVVRSWPSHRSATQGLRRPVSPVPGRKWPLSRVTLH